MWLWGDVFTVYWLAFVKECIEMVPGINFLISEFMYFVFYNRNRRSDGMIKTVTVTGVLGGKNGVQKSSSLDRIDAEYIFHIYVLNFLILY